MYKISGPRGKAGTFLSSFQKVVVDVVKLFNKYGYLTIQCMTQEKKQKKQWSLKAIKEKEGA